MIDFGLIALSAAIGLVAVAPLGPVNIIVIKSSLRRGIHSGLLAGLGSVAGDGIFAAIAAYGVRWIEDLVRLQAVPLQVACGLMLVAMGVRTARKGGMAAQVLDEPLGAARATLTFLTTFGLTAANPATLMGFIALFASMSEVLALGSAPYRPGVAVIGVMFGSFAWWLFLSLLTARLKARLSLGHIATINRVAGIAIAASGILLLLHGAW